MLFDQFICTSQLAPPQVWLFAAPFAAVWVGPNFQAHLSPFSFPLASYHAFANESDCVSSASCAMMLTAASASRLPVGVVDCQLHELGQAAGEGMLE
jgi:hypothetical protein